MAFLRSVRLESRTFFWAAVSARSWPVSKRVWLTVWLEREEGLLVLGDLRGEGPVLVAEVDQVADVGDRVRERVGRQDRLEHRRPIAVVGGPEVLGQDRLALGQLGRLGVLLGLDLGELGVEVGELGDLAVVDLLDRVDLAGHLLDVGLDVGEVGVDPDELGRGRLHDDAQVGLQPVELGDLALLGGDLAPRAPSAGRARSTGRRRSRPGGAPSDPLRSGSEEPRDQTEADP